METISKFKIKPIFIISILVVISKIVYVFIDNNISNDASTNEYMSLILNIVLLSIVNICTLYSYIVLLKTPIKAILFIIGAQIVTLIHELLAGVTVEMALFDLGLTFIISIIMICIHWNSISKKIANEISHSKLQKRIVKIINYERKPIKINIFTRIIIYSLMISTVMIMTNNSSAMNTVASNTRTRLFASVATLLPLFTIFALLSTSRLAYEIYIVQIIMEILTIIYMYKLNIISYSSILALLAEFYVAYLCIIKYIPINTIKSALSSIHRK